MMIDRDLELARQNTLMTYTLQIVRTKTAGEWAAQASSSPKIAQHSGKYGEDCARTRYNGLFERQYRAK